MPVVVMVVHFSEVLIEIMLCKWVGTNVAKRGHLYIVGEETNAERL